jgi:hypothetical protein
VTIGITHAETMLEYGLRDGMQWALRLPYDVKAQRVRYTTLDGAPFTPAYGDIHHRTETLRGISDPSLMLDWGVRQWVLGIGTTIPIGHTVEDPVRLGNLGLKHEHIQFGSGTFEPKLLLQWSNANLFARAEGTVPLYQSGKGYKPPLVIAWSAGPTYRNVTVMLDGQHQTIGKWHGLADEGTGFDAGGVRVQLAMPFHGVTVTSGVYRELWSHGLDEQSFHQRVTVSIGCVVRR